MMIRGYYYVDNVCQKTLFTESHITNQPQNWMRVKEKACHPMIN